MSDEYTKMVLALPKNFFQGWEWKTGDRAITLNKNVVMVLSNDCWSKIYLKCVDPYAKSNPMAMFCRKRDLRPLPSQKQLQEKVINFYMENNKMTRPQALIHFIGWYGDHLTDVHDCEYNIMKASVDYEISFDSLDELMLEYVVMLIYFRRWDGEKWIVKGA